MTRSSTPARIPATALREPAVLLASGFGAGLSPIAPGTCGSVVGVLFYFGLSGLPILLYVTVVVVLAVAGVWLCHRAGRRLGVTDHPGIVWDEIVGVLITMTGSPWSWQSTLLGFALFRAFDILKPWPIGRIDRGVGGGLGVMLDDVVAGLYALASLQILRNAFGIA